MQSWFTVVRFDVVMRPGSTSVLSSQDLGSTYIDERDRTLVARQSIRRLEQLGYTVTVETSSQVA
jgi:hypothetical protein